MSEEFKPLIEAALFMSGRAMSIEDIAKICNSGNLGVVRRAIEDLQKDYLSRGIEMYEADGRFGMRVRKDLEDRFMHLAPETDMAPAVLKTLALIAYEQPIRQSDIIKHRGNGAYKYIRKLKDAEMIETHKSGRTKMITVTNKFKDYFQLQDLSRLRKKEEAACEPAKPVAETGTASEAPEGDDVQSSL